MIPFSDVERILGRIDKIQKEMSKVLKPYEIEVKQSLKKTLEGTCQPAH